MDFFKRNIPWIAAITLVVFSIGGYRLMLSPPGESPWSIVVIARGTSVPEAAKILADAHIIAHPSLLRFILRISGAGSRVQAGAYRFEAPENLLVVAYRLFKGDYGLPPVRITFPEGVTVRDVAASIADAFPLLSAQEVISAGKSREGYLFPDTYLFSPDASVPSILKAMRANFDTKIATLSGEVGASGHSLSDIVIMASLVEKEVRTSTSRRIVTGILWNRLALGMPLQVDAVFGYIFERDTYSPSLEDLKVDSPYNTYTHTGLPPGPINNPGLESIEAAVNPEKTDYLYYLTGKDGLMHYATTYARHQANRKKYLQ